MLLRNGILTLISAVLFFSIAGYTQSASIGDQKIRICNNEHCLKTSEVIDVDKYKNQNILVTPQPVENLEVKDEKFIDYMTLIMTGVIPTFGFIWWLLNSQQDKKIIEFSQSQDIKFKELMKEVVDRQDENSKNFSNELKELINKIDNITKNFQDDRLEQVKTLSNQNEKIANLMLEVAMLKNYMKKLDNVENFLNKQFDEYYIRK